ncbi:MAG: hypothetical protein ACR5K6_01560 [Wolbachia sp.]
METNSKDSSNSRDAQFTISYDKIKEIVTQNPNITAEEFYEKLKKEIEASTDKKRDTKTFDSFADAVRSGASITDNRSVFLKIAELFTGLDTVIHLKSLAFKTILDIAVESEQADVVEILLESSKFNEEEKLQALNSAIVQGNIQGAQSFLGHIEYEKALGVLNTLKTTVLHREKIEGMRQFFSYDKNLTKEEKAQTLIDAVMSYNVSEVKLLLEYMVGIPETSIEGFVEIMKQRQSSLKEEGGKWCSKTNAIIQLLELAINKKKEEQSTKENGAASSSNIGGVVSTDQTDSLNIDSDVKDLYESINKTITLAIRHSSEVTSLEDL